MTGPVHSKSGALKQASNVDMNMKREVLSKVDQVSDVISSSPIVKGLIDGGLSLVPFFGLAITSALDTRAFQLFEANSRRAWVLPHAEYLRLLKTARTGMRYLSRHQVLSEMNRYENAWRLIGRRQPA